MPLRDEIIQFIADQAGVSPSNLSVRTRLLHDLDIAGDDADLLFVEFGKRFDVDLTGLNLSRHFPCEFLWFHRGPDCVPITIGDMIDAAVRRRWLP